MEITSTKPSINVAEQAPQVAAAEAAQRRQLIRASRSVNESGLLGRNQLVFLIDRATHRPVIRVEDRETHEVILQLPPEYVLRLAQGITTGSAQMPFSADM
ncbi:MAG TPA: flagellar protein FlaG [Bryobacteraceae bacterium]|nr:flagellar protein FlaG [Bryobacteraceae bacterium]